MSGVGVDLETTKASLLVFILGKHTFDCLFNDFARIFGEKLFETELLEATGETGVRIVFFVGNFFTGNVNFGCVDSNDEVTIVQVTTRKRLSLTNEKLGDFGRNTTQGFTIKIN